MKLLKNIASFGPALIVAGYVYYSVQGIWNVPVQIVLEVIAPPKSAPQ